MVNKQGQTALIFASKLGNLDAIKVVICFIRDFFFLIFIINYIITLFIVIVRI